MAKTGSLDQSLAQKQPSSSSSGITPATGMRARVTTSSSGRQQVEFREMLEIYPQKAFKADHSHDQASGLYQAPMLRRWLDGNNTKDAGQLRDRDEYPKGVAGMSEYLNDWDRTWQRAGPQANGKDLKKRPSKKSK